MKTRRHHRSAATVGSIIQKGSGDLNGPNPAQFLAPLPAEIVMRIASYLSQRDCFTCTTVCSSWYTSAPRYMQNVWRHVSISSSNFPNRRSIWEQCVREYAKEIVLLYTSNYHNLVFRIQKLIDCQCQKVESLGMLALLKFEMSLTCAIELAVPYKISQKRIQALLSLSNRIGNQITQLTIRDRFVYTNILDAIQAFPNLVKLSYIGETDHWEVQSHLRPPMLPQLSSLTYLHVDSPIHMKLQLEPILQSSPNLQFLIYGKCKSLLVTEHPNPSIVTNLEDISLWCPKLIYLEACSRRELRYHRPKLLNYVKRKEAPTMGLRNLMISECNGYGPDEARKYLLQHASTLEFVGFEYITSSPSSSLAMNKLRAPQLRTLSLMRADYPFFDYHGQHSTEQLWNTIELPECPLLETLDISEALVKKSQLDLSVLKNLNKLKHLRLSRLKLKNDRINVFKNTTVIHGANITSITLNNVYSVNDEVLHVISSFPMLQKLTIAFPDDDYNCTNDALIRFSNQLIQTSIQELSISGLQSQYLPPLFLQAIGKMSTLHTVVVKCSVRNIYNDLTVDALDILKMLEYSTSLKTVDLSWLIVTGIDSNCSIAAFLEQNLRGYKVKVDKRRRFFEDLATTARIQLIRT